MNYILAFFAICFLGVFLQSVISLFKFNPKDKSVLITGCDTGFGLLLAKQLNAKGMTIFAGTMCMAVELFKITYIGPCI